MASTFAAVIAAHSIVAALICRVRSGRGDLIEVPLFDAAFDAIGFFGEDPATRTQLSLDLGLGRDVGVIRRFRSRPDASVAPAAAPGYHTRPVLKELGYSDEDVDKLLETRIIATDASCRMSS